jgi:hypothetical protein
MNPQFALAAVGRTESLLDYNRIRAGESTQSGFRALLTVSLDLSSMVY